MKLLKPTGNAEVHVTMNAESGKKEIEFGGSLYDVEAAMVYLIMKIAEKHACDPEDVAEYVLQGVKAVVALDKGENPTKVILASVTDYILSKTITDIVEKEILPKTAAQEKNTTGNSSENLSPETEAELEKILEEWRNRKDVK